MISLNTKVFIATLITLAMNLTLLRISTANAQTLEPVKPRASTNYTTEGAGNDPFFSLEGFFPLFQIPGNNLTYIEGKLLSSTENSALGGNLLLGHRFLSDSKQQIIGGYISYDTRNTGDTVFNQLGAGFESLGENLDFHTNFYFPIGNSRNLVNESLTGTSSFQGNFLALDKVSQVQQALTGLDAEVGTKLASLGSGSLKGYAGVYYYTGENIPGFVGVRGRLIARPNDTLVAGVTLQSDPQFDTRLIFNLGISFSGTAKKNRKSDVLSRIGESSDRTSSITVKERLIKDTVLATNTPTGEPLQFIHVNLGLGNSNGSFESPFSTVAQALGISQSNNIIYVRDGKNPGIPSFKITDGVAVVSNASPQFIDTILGKVQLPGSGSGVKPNITGTVTMGNDTKLNGFAISSAIGAGIEGTNIRNISVQNNSISNSQLEGIKLTDVTGKVDISQNQLQNNGYEQVTRYSTPYLMYHSGILITNNVGYINLNINNNTIQNSAKEAIDIRFGGDTKFTTSITNNQILDNGKLYEEPLAYAFVASLDKYPAYLEADAISISLFKNAEGNLNIFNNNVSRNRGGISTFASAGNININITGNTIVNNTATYTQPGIRTSFFESSQTNLVVRNNQVSNNSQGISFNANSNSQVKAVIESNTVTNNRGDGIKITNQDSQTSVAVKNNIVTGNNTQPPTDSNTTTTAADLLIEDRSSNNIGKMCLSLDNNQIGSFALADKIQFELNPRRSFLLPPEYVSVTTFSSGKIEVELPGIPGNSKINQVVSPSEVFSWKGGTVPAGSCGFGSRN
jgi:trimeric autotransporter adhesin